MLFKPRAMHPPGKQNVLKYAFHYVKFSIFTRITQQIITEKNFICGRKTLTALIGLMCNSAVTIIGSYVSI